MPGAASAGTCSSGSPHLSCQGWAAAGATLQALPVPPTSPPQSGLGALPTVPAVLSAHLHSFTQSFDHLSIIADLPHGQRLAGHCRDPGKNLK